MATANPAAMGGSTAVSAARDRGYPGLMRLAVVLLLTALAALADRLLQPDAFPVQRVSVEGEFQRVAPSELQQAVADAVKGNFFVLDLERVEAAAKRVPWVEHVSVRREWPRAIHIQYTEHELVARWGERGWLNTGGEVVQAPGRPEVVSPPRLDGPPGSGKKVLALYRRLAPIAAVAGLRLRGLRLTKRHAWEARVGPPETTTGFELFLGRQRLEARLARFVRVYPKVLTTKAAFIEQVDLRYPNGFTVAWKPAYLDRMANTEKGFIDDKKGG